MVRIFPVKTLVPVDATETLPQSITDAPNRFRSRSYDRSFGSDDCTRWTGVCSCCMCSDTPVVIAPCGDSMCERFYITLRNVQEYLEGGLLKVHSEGSLMIYRQFKSDGSSQVGIFAAIDVEDCCNGIVLPHENVTGKDDVTVLNKTKVNKAQIDPIMLIYRENIVIDAIIQRIMQEEEPFQEIANSSSPLQPHCVWSVRCPEDICAIQDAFEAIDRMYIADGHHRTAAACRERTKASQGRNVPRSARYLTALLFSASQLNVLSYNRCVRSLPVGTSTNTLLEKISTVFDIQNFTSSLSTVDVTLTVTQCDIPTFMRTESPTSISVASPINSPSYLSPPACVSENMSYPTAPPAEQGVIYMYIAHSWYSLRVRSDQCIENISSDPLSSIGCQILLERLLKPVFGFSAEYNENSMIYVDGREGAEGVQRLVDCAEAAMGFMVCPVPTSEVMKVADAGQLLPAKATFFDPKPMSNLLLRLLR